MQLKINDKFLFVDKHILQIKHIVEIYFIEDEDYGDYSIHALMVGGVDKMIYLSDPYSIQRDFRRIQKTLFEYFEAPKKQTNKIKIRGVDV